VYRVQIVEQRVTRDAPIQRWQVCARCYEALRAVLRAEASEAAPAPSLGHPPPWHVTETAARLFARALRDSRRQRAPRADEIGEPEWQDAREELLRIVPTATYRERDRAGRELWRSPPSAYGLRWVVQAELALPTRREKVALVPAVVWVGLSRPPERIWTP
jgi:hypothetical protein